MVRKSKAKSEEDRKLEEAKKFEEDKINYLVKSIGFLLEKLELNNEEIRKIKNDMILKDMVNQDNKSTSGRKRKQKLELERIEVQKYEPQEDEIKITRTCVASESENPFDYVKSNAPVDPYRRNLLNELEEDYKKIVLAANSRQITQGFSICYLYILIHVLCLLRDDKQFQEETGGMLTVTCDFSSVLSDLTHNLYDPVLKRMTIPWIEKDWNIVSEYVIKDNEPSKIPFEFFLLSLMTNCRMSFLDTAEAVRDGRNITDILRDTASNSYDIRNSEDILVLALMTDGNAQTLFYRLKDVKELSDRKMFREYDPDKRLYYQKRAVQLFNKTHSFDIQSVD